MIVNPGKIGPKCKARWSTYGVADAAVGLCCPTAATVTLIIHRNLQIVFEPYWLYSEALVVATRSTAPRLHAHIKWNLQRNKTKNGATQNITFGCIADNYSPLQKHWKSKANCFIFDVKWNIWVWHQKIKVRQAINVSFWKASCPGTSITLIHTYT